MTMTETAAVPRAMTDAQRREFERDGYLVISGALSRSEVDFYATALDLVYQRERAAGRVDDTAAMHRLSAVAGCPAAVGLIDHPSTFGLVWSVLGWNIHVYHSHLDVHPPLREPIPFRYRWHQDGGRQNQELETDPRPRLSVKVAFWLSDLSRPGRGNFKVVPGSHRTNRIDGPPRRDMPWPDPDGAVEVCVNAGDAVFFDRRLWHTRTANYSDITRKAIFVAYSHRWAYGRDDNAELLAGPEFPALHPVRRQLLGDPLTVTGQAPGDHQWGHYPQTTPLYGYLRDHGLLDPGYPPLAP